MSDLLDRLYWLSLLPRLRIPRTAEQRLLRAGRAKMAKLAEEAVEVG
jgi:hypothetical protein